MDLTLETFQGRVGETFRVPLSGAVIELSLASVERLTEGEGEVRERTPFSLLFRGGPPNRFLPQRTYEIEHDGLGTVHIFLVPLGPDKEGMRYEAVFT
jgi:hypothetical protein